MKEKVIRKKRRLAFKCYHCDWEGYVQLEGDEDLKEYSLTIITHKGDRSGERDRICYCPECDHSSIRVSFVNNLDPWALRQKVAFTAKDPPERLRHSEGMDFGGEGLYGGRY